MSLVKCKECGNEVSDKAALCPKCGIALIGIKSSFTKKLSAIEVIGTLAGVGIILLLMFGEKSKEPAPINPPVANSISVDTKLNEPPEIKVDLSEPVITKENAVICPFSMLHEKRSDRSFQAANEAVVSLFDRKEKLSAVGCEEWKEGVRLYLIDPQEDETWIEASTFSDGSDRFYALKYNLKNIEKPAMTKGEENLHAKIKQQKENALIELNSCLDEEASIGEYSHISDNFVTAKRLLAQCQALADKLVLIYSEDNDNDYNLNLMATRAILQEYGTKHPF